MAEYKELLEEVITVNNFLVDNNVKFALLFPELLAIYMGICGKSRAIHAKGAPRITGSQPVIAKRYRYCIYEACRFASLDETCIKSQAYPPACSSRRSIGEFDTKSARRRSTTRAEGCQTVRKGRLKKHPRPYKTSRKKRPTAR